MADIKKDQERDELFRHIYKIATDLVHAGHVAEWDFKSYVLGMMFYRYISENFTAYINEGEITAAIARGETDPHFSYAELSDEQRAFSSCPRSCSAVFLPVRIRTTT